MGRESRSSEVNYPEHDKVRALGGNDSESITGQWEDAVADIDARLACVERRARDTSILLAVATVIMWGVLIWSWVTG